MAANDAAHTLMLRAGRLGPEAVEFGGREFRVGDRVLCRHNDSSLGVRNGTRATVVSLDDGALTLRADKGATRQVPHAYAAEHLEHGYALTGHAAQGATVEHAFVLLPDQGALHEWGYVACTRARTDTHLYLAEHDTIERETPLRQPDPGAPPERAARALERSAAEPLALDQRRGRPDTIIRFVAQQQEQLDRQRDRAAERLAAAQRDLQHLHWWNRGRRAELETEIDLHQTTLERADEKREQLIQLAERRSQMLALARERDELTPSLQPEPSRPRLEREPPGLGFEL